MRHIALFGLALLLAASACRTGKVNPTAGVTAIAPNDATPRDIPTASEGTRFAPPRHLVFAPGETIASDGFGIFFLDPVMGAAEAWVTPTEDGCSFSRARADGARLFFICAQPQRNATPGAAANKADSTTTYVLDTVSGDWSPITRPVDPYGITTLDGAALTPDAISAISNVVRQTPGAQPRLQQWAPDGSAFVVDFATPNPDHPTGLLYLIRMDSSEPIWLTDRPEWAVWAPDSSKFVLTERRLGQRLRTTDAIIVLDAKGRKLWSRDAFVFATNPRWSLDSRRLGVEVLHSQPSTEEPSPAYDLSVFDGMSGDPVFRVLGAFACAGQYWTADSRLVVSPYGPGNAVRILVDPIARTLFGLDWYVTPSPIDPDLGIFFDLNDFYAVSLKDSSKRLIARTTVRPAWDFLHEPLFAGGRIMFRSQHNGHGGCGEGSPPLHLPQMELQFPPFTDP